MALKSKRPVKNRTSSTKVNRRKSSKKLDDLPTRKPGQGKKGRAWAIYGRAGSGKTTLAGSFPTPALLINIKDDGDDSLIGMKGVEVLDIETAEDIENAYWWLKDNADKFKTVIWDTATQLQQLLVEELVGEKVKKKGKQAGDWGTMSQSDWGTVASKMKTLITDFKHLPMQVVFLAQDRVFNGGDENDTDGMIDPEMGPRLSPAVMSHLCAAVDVIGHTFIRTKTTKMKVKGKVKEKETKEYCLRLGPDASYITKFRKPKDVELPAFLTDPTYEDILEAIQGEA